MPLSPSDQPAVQQPQNRMQDRALALAALVYCALAVHRVAQGSALPQVMQQLLLAPVLARNSDSVSQLLPPSAERQGLLQEAKKLLRGNADSARVLAYVVELLELAARLRNHKSAAAALGAALDAVTEPDPVLLAKVYQHSISTLGRRIQVQGDPTALQREAVAAQVRALLLAGVRYAWLWHQLGGRRWQLIIRRQTTLTAMTALERQTPADLSTPG